MGLKQIKLFLKWCYLGQFVQIAQGDLLEYLDIWDHNTSGQYYLGLIERK